MAYKKNAPAQRGNAGGGRENQVGAGLEARVAPGDDYREHIRRLVDQAPAFTEAQRSALAVLLRADNRAGEAA
ncbi:MAG: hypothetical protein M3Q22_03495 [Actinomycetota bacterium]|nr:hypothetical protein [Actinomycetota bacterium]